MIHKIDTNQVRRMVVFNSANRFTVVVIPTWAVIGPMEPSSSYTGTPSAEQYRTMNPTPKGSETQ